MGIFNYFRKNKSENKKLKQDILAKKTPQEEYDDLKKDCLKFEKEYLAKNKDTKFDFFGYLISQDEIPFFMESTKNKHEVDFQYLKTVTPCTPKLLEFCVKNLLPYDRKYEAQDMDAFIYKWNQIAEHYCVFSKEEWDGVISELISYLKMPHQLKKDELKEIMSSLTTEQLKSIDWNQFGKEVKRQRQLPPSYNSKPTEVNVWLDNDGIARASLKFNSTTSSSVREFHIRKSTVFEKVNDGLSMLNEDLSQIWSDFCGSVFEESEQNKEKQQ